MDDALYETASGATSSEMDGVRDEDQPGRTSYEKNKQVFEGKNDWKHKSREESINSVNSMLGGRVSDRKKFFEHHIIEQKQREKALVSPIQSNCKPSLSSRKEPEDSSSLVFKEERSDSESLFRKKSVTIGGETIHFGNPLDNTNDRIGPEPFSGTSFPTSEFDLLSPNYSLEEQEGPTRKDYSENPFHTTAPTVESIPVSNSRDCVEKAESFDLKISSLKNANNDNFEMRGRKVKESVALWVSQSEQIGQSDYSKQSAPICIEDEPISAEENPCNRPIVKIQVTNTRVENQNADERHDNEDEARQYTNIDEIITEFQQVSAQLSKSFMTNSSPKNVVTSDRSCERSKPAENGQDDMDDTSSYGAYLVQNTLTVNDFNELAEKIQVSNSKENDNNYVCPSESTDYSIDSKGNSKEPNSVSTKSAKSAKSSIKSKVKRSGMGKMLKKAKKGMGKSMKQISQFTAIVKNTIKTKPTKPSASTMDESHHTADANSDLKNCLICHDIFDEKLAEVLVTENKGHANIYTALRYVDVGKRLLHSGGELQKTNDLKGAKEATRKAHTYAYVGRQFAKQYLMAHREEYQEGIGTNPVSDIPGVSDDAITAFEELILSILQCDGPCNGDYRIQKSRVQVDEALEILTKLSEAEVAVMTAAESSEIGTDRKSKVEEAMTNNRHSTVGNGKRGGGKAGHDIGLAVNSFVSDLRSFYEIDKTLKLSKVFMNSNEGKNEDDSDRSSMNDDSISYNYSESLKFDHGRSYHTRSDTTVGSFKQEQTSTTSSSSRRGKNTREESLAQGIRPGTTVVSISVKNKNFKNRSNSLSNKKSSPKKWLAVGTRKQK